MYIDIKDICFKYKNCNNNIIDNFSIDIKKGEIVSILGESGSGKSTMLRIIAGLEEVHEGYIRIDNKVILDKNTFVMPEKRGIGMVFQDYALFPHMTVSGNIKFGLKNMSKTSKEQRCSEMLQLVNLKEHSNKYPYELSGGQQQRVALARALAPSPTLLLLDEPFSNLDAHLQNKIRTELNEIIRKSGITSIFVTHDKKDAKAISDRVVILDQGKITKIGFTRDVL